MLSPVPILLLLVALAMATPRSGSAQTIDVRTTTSTDDAEEFASGSMYLTSTDLELIHDTSDQTVGMRWVNLTIPKGATITSATIQFSAKAAQSEVTNLVFAGQAADNPVTFGSANLNVSSRPRTAATVAWAPTAWAAGETGANERTPDLSPVIQEVVSRTGWTSGNAMVIIVTGTGHRTAYSYNGKATGSPLLHITYTTSGGPPPPPTDYAPVARLSVSPVATPGLKVQADGSASTDTDATPIASYHFDFGDGSAVANTNAPTATVQHTYASGGTYTVKLTCTDTGNLTSAQVTQNVTVTASGGGGGNPVAVYAGYYDTHHPHNLKPKPSPWRNSPNTVFVGAPDKAGGDDWDSSALRVDNLTSSTLSGIVVSCDIGSKHYALWGTNSIPAGQHLVLAQTAFDNFDGSDRNVAGCYSCNPNDCLTKVLSTVPVVHVTVGGVTTNYPDVTQQINTGGVDRAGCPYTGTRNDESEQWLQLAPASAPAMAASATAAGPGEGAAGPSTEAARTLWLGDPYPNPSHGELTLRFSLPKMGPVKIEMFDVTGRRVRVVLDQVLDAGEYRDTSILSGVGPGVYFYRLSSPLGTLRKTFVVEH